MTSTRPRYRWCSVPGCINEKGNPDISAFTLPKDPARAQCWLDRICLEIPADHITIHVCEEHFEDALINRVNPKKKRLDRDAVPTLNLPQSTQLDKTISVPSGSETHEEPGLAETSSIKKRKKYRISQAGNRKKTKANESIEFRGQHPSQSTKESPVPWLLAPESTFDLNSISEDSDTKSKEQTDNNLVNFTEKDLNQHASTSQATDSPLMTISNTANDTEGPNKEEYKRLTRTNPYIMKLHNIYALMKRKLFAGKAHKQLCLKLYLSFPNEYKTLHKAMNAVHQSELKDVFDDSLITIDRLALFAVYLNIKASSMTTEQKQCFLSIGEFKIKPRFYYDTKKDYLIGIHDFDQELKPEPATTAVVLILQGLFEEWKQPISVAYLGNNSPPIKPWIEKNIKKVAKMGFNIRAVVPHRGTSCITKDITVDYKVIYCFHDVSSLFISLYYHFTKFNLVCASNKSIISCQYIIDCFILEKNKSNDSLVSKLTENLLKPASIQELNIESVMNVFSMTTAAAISANIDSRILDESAKETVTFITRLSKLYDILNSGYMGDNKKRFVGDQSEVDYLRDMLQLLSNLKLNTRSNIAYDISYKILIERFKSVIVSVLSFFSSLKKEHYDHLPIWRLTDDAIDLFYDHVKKHSKSITKPTAKDVDSIFKQTAIIHLLKNHAKKVTPNDLDKVLTEFYNKVRDFKCLNDDYANRDIATNCKVSSSDYMTLDVERKDSIIFLAGFLLKKCNDIHRCTNKAYTLEALSALCMSESIMPDVTNNICALPGPDFIEFVETMEISFRTFMNKEVLFAPNKKIINGLLKSLEAVDVRMPCSCFPIFYVQKLYMRFRLYHTLKYNNELLKTKLRKRIIVNKL